MSLGADMGRLSFQDLAGQLVVFGQGRFWAGQLAEAAAAGETLINNRLYTALDDRADIECRQMRVAPNNGEAFWARRLILSERSDAANQIEKGGAQP